MTAPILKLNHGKYQYGDVVRLTRGVPKSGGKRYKFVGAAFDPEDLENPLYLDLIEIGRGQFRCIKPEFVIKDIAASKEAQARIAEKEVK
jgi:hypothetical protein